MNAQYKNNPKYNKILPNLKKILLGSNTLGLNVLELHFVMLANHDQNV